MIYYAVIDTNVIVSAMLNPDSIPGTVLKCAFAGIIIPFINKEILDEYIEVISRKEFGFDHQDIDYFLTNINERAIFVDRTPTDELFVDKKDVVFYEIALTGRSKTNAYLVTGNTKHFPKKPFVVTPREMVDIINSN